MDGINGARPVRHRKQKRQARRRNTRPVAAHLRRLKQGKNDLLLAEFSALGTSGVELARWFSAKRPEIKVLVASDWLWEVESCLGDLPRVGVLAKDFTPTEPARMVRAILH